MTNWAEIPLSGDGDDFIRGYRRFAHGCCMNQVSHTTLRVNRDSGRSDRVACAPAPLESMVSVYVDRGANAAAVRLAVAELAKPTGVDRVVVDDRSMGETFGCRIAVDLTGPFDQLAEGPKIAREFAQRLAAVIGWPSFALHDLLRADPTRFLH